jgi:transcriptional regulator with XRE-family HTH domain
MNRKTNGASVATIRKALGMRQGALAASAGITSAYLSMIENGLRQPEPEVTRRLADELGVSLESITYPAPEPETATA